MISNQEAAKFIREIGEFLEMKSIPFKPRAYEKAAEIIEGLEEEIAGIYNKGGLKALEDMPGIGVSIAEKIEELIKTGKLKYHAGLKKTIPVDLESFRGVEGLGPKTIFKLYKKLGVKNLKGLELVIKLGKIAKLKGFGQKSEENLKKGIAFVKKGGGRFVLGDILADVRQIENQLKKLKEVEKLIVAGSTRRRKETIGDVDILITSKNPKPIMDYFVKMSGVVRVTAKGVTKSAVKLKNGLDVDVRVVPEESFGAAANYFTGSKDHNIALRERAIKLGYKLNEYGLFKGEKRIAGKTEEDLYQALGLVYIEPEMRENTGEIELAEKKKL